MVGDFLQDFNLYSAVSQVRKKALLESNLSAI